MMTPNSSALCLFLFVFTCFSNSSGIPFRLMRGNDSAQAAITESLGIKSMQLEIKSLKEVVLGLVEQVNLLSSRIEELKISPMTNEGKESAKAIPERSVNRLYYAVTVSVGGAIFALFAVFNSPEMRNKCLVEKMLMYVGVYFYLMIIIVAVEQIFFA